jgi:hypothetical protein
MLPSHRWHNGSRTSRFFSLAEPRWAKGTDASGVVVQAASITGSPRRRRSPQGWGTRTVRARRSRNILSTSDKSHRPQRYRVRFRRAGTGRSLGRLSVGYHARGAQARYIRDSDLGSRAPGRLTAIPWLCVSTEGRSRSPLGATGASTEPCPRAGNFGRGRRLRPTRKGLVNRS